MALLPPKAITGLASRRLAWEVLLAVAAGAYADVALERALRDKPLQGQDRGLATELAYGAIRRRRWLDAWLDRLGKVPALKQPPKLRWLLHLGLYQLFWMERIPASAAVNTSVELAKAVGLARLAPVVNGLLRAALRARDAGEVLAMPTDPAGSLALQHSLPEWFTALLLQWRGASGAAAVATACNQVPSLDLRINRLKTSPDQVVDALASALRRNPSAVPNWLGSSCRWIAWMNSSSPWFQPCWEGGTVGCPLGRDLCPMRIQHQRLGISRKPDPWATVNYSSAIDAGEAESCLRVNPIPHLGDVLLVWFRLNG